MQFVLIYSGRKMCNSNALLVTAIDFTYAIAFSVTRHPVRVFFHTIVMDSSKKIIKLSYLVSLLH